MDGQAGIWLLTNKTTHRLMLAKILEVFLSDRCVELRSDYAK